MDEPLSGLDDEKRQTILPLIETVRDEFAVPMLYVTHARDEAQRLANRIIMIDRGRVVGSETLG
jgi:molybdate transport system ATP-binding protein